MGVKMFLQDIYEIRKSYDVVEDINISILMNKFSNQTNNLQMLVKSMMSIKMLIRYGHKRTFKT